MRYKPYRVTLQSTYHLPMSESDREDLGYTGTPVDCVTLDMEKFFADLPLEDWSVLVAAPIPDVNQGTLL